MKYKKIIYLGLVLSMLFAGCGLKEGVVQKEPKSFLWFTGNIQNAIVYIDDLTPIILKQKILNETNDYKNNTKRSDLVHYEISPGKHTIVVKISGEEVVNRNVLLGNGLTKEIQIP